MIFLKSGSKWACRKGFGNGFGLGFGIEVAGGLRAERDVNAADSSLLVNAAITSVVEGGPNSFGSIFNSHVLPLSAVDLHVFNALRNVEVGPI